MTLWTLSLAASAQTAPPVVGGVAAAPGDWPTVAALFDADERLICSGVLIDADHILTAGHCGAAPPTSARMDLIDVNGAGGTHREILSVDVEPGYWEGLDVALVRLDAPVSLTPPEVLIGCATNQLYDGAPAELVGFGATTPGVEPDGLLYAATLPIRDADCGDPDRGCREAVAGAELLAGGDGLDSCAGDSGGPLFVWTDWGEPLLVGVVSRAAWPATTACGDGGIYVRIDALTAWLAERGVTSPSPECPPRAGNNPPRPSAGVLTATPGDVVTGQVFANDPDRDDRHAFRLGRPPTYGEARLSQEGLLTLSTDPTYVGDDEAEVLVSDGVAEVALTVRIAVRAAEADTPLTPIPWSGCGAPAAALLLLPALGARRRRPLTQARSPS
ncbi:trypsin-like serine protease [Myxococcota bacterium]|nr:trypsin-like serine protease [Myxococcota bacterium]